MRCPCLLALALLLAGLPAQNRTALFQELGKRHLPRPESGLQALVVGDLDGDGISDAVVGRYGQNLLLLNDGTGVFADATASRLPADADDTRALALGDVDGDGDLDLVLGNFANSVSCRLYLNDGRGFFADVTPLRLPVFKESAACLALADVDGDGDLDILVGNRLYAAYTNRLLLNDGKGFFADFSFGEWARAVDQEIMAVGDVDGDGDADILLGRRTDPVKLLLNDGRGKFADATAVQMPGKRISALCLRLGDVDGDGDLDLYVGADGQDQLYRNDGKGTFAEAAGAIPAESFRTRGVVLADLDGDGDPDLVAGNESSTATGPGQNRLFLNDGRGGFTEAARGWPPLQDEPTTALAAADADGDWDPDLVVANYASLRLLLNDGKAGFLDATEGPWPALGGEAGVLSLADMDGDGDLDLVPGVIGKVLRNDGRGWFQDSPAGSLPPGLKWPWPAEILPVDVDGDGDLDLLGRVGSFLLLNDGKGGFQDAAATHLPAGFMGEVVAALDLDRDGDVDLFVNPASLQVPQILLNDGSGVFADGTAGRVPVFSGPYVFGVYALGDVDGDGDPDLYADRTDYQNPQNSRLTVLYLNDGKGFFQAPAQSLLPPGFVPPATVYGFHDLDGDGDPDLLGQADGSPAVYENYNQGRLSSGYKADTSGAVLAVGDVTGDGRPDLVVQNGTELVLLELSGTIFRRSANLELPGPVGTQAANRVTLGDLDGDGDLDLALGSKAGARLFYQRTRQAWTPFLARPGRPWPIQVDCLGPGSLALPMLADRGGWLSLPPFGVLRLDLKRTAFLPFLVIPSGRSAAIGLALPRDPALVGIELHCQAFLADLYAPSAGRFTNLVVDRVTAH